MADITKLKNNLHIIQNLTINPKLLLEVIGESQFVLIGESTHGTHEFYQMRAEITKFLILEKGFNAIAIEGDWPDTYNINRFIKGDDKIGSSVDSLSGFKRFPTWMWRNKVVVNFIDWLREYNAKLPMLNKIGFYGLDLYSLNTSIEVIIKYLEKKDREAAKRAKQRYACFANFKDELQYYGYTTSLDMTKSCEDVVLEQLLELNKNSYKYLSKNGFAEDELFHIKQNANLVKNAEKYYRSMFDDRTSSWNIRDMHMAETLENLTEHLTSKLGRPAKIVVWAHNSHIGDARATQSAQYGQLNIGQLVREKYGDRSFLLGFLTNTGTVTAASAWDAVAERKHVRSALNNSYEYYFHNLNIGNFLINFKNKNDLVPNNFLERAIGVIYLPQNERISHYFYANIVEQFDSLIYLDKTTAIEPLEKRAIWHKGEVLETYPSGL